jgi:hypothetical protein
MASAGDWGVWAFSAVVGSASWVSLLLLVGWVMARMERDRVQSIYFPVIGLSTYAFFLALGILVTALGLFASNSHARGMLWYGSAAWLGLAGLSAVRATLGRWSPKVLLYSGRVVGLALFAAEHLPSPYWQMDSETENASDREEAGPSPAAEDALYRQPKFLETTLASLKPGHPGVTDLYFVGFGADAE